MNPTTLIRQPDVQFTRLDCSNFASEHAFVIQGWNGLQWQDSRHGGRTPREAHDFVRANADKIALPGTKFRIVPSL